MLIESRSWRTSLSSSFRLGSSYGGRSTSSGCGGPGADIDDGSRSWTIGRSIIENDGLDGLWGDEGPLVIEATPGPHPWLRDDVEALDELRGVWRRLSPVDIEWARGAAATLAGGEILTSSARARLSGLLIRFGLTRWQSRHDDGSTSPPRTSP